jgi:activating signal cointegrator 1
VHVLTLTQPWASLMALGEKTVETRSWRPPDYMIGQRIAIHAAKGCSPIGGERGLRRLIERPPFLDALYVSRLARTEDVNTLGRVQALARALPRSSIVAWGTLHAVHPTAQARITIGETSSYPDFELDFGDYTPGRFAWFFRDVHAVEPPVPHTGAQGLRILPVAIESAVHDNSRSVRQHPVAVRRAVN